LKPIAACALKTGLTQPAVNSEISWGLWFLWLLICIVYVGLGVSAVVGFIANAVVVSLIAIGVLIVYSLVRAVCANLQLISPTQVIPRSCLRDQWNPHATIVAIVGMLSGAALIFTGAINLKAASTTNDARAARQTEIFLSPSSDWRPLCGAGCFRFNGPGKDQGRARKHSNNGNNGGVRVHWSSNMNVG